MDRHAGSTVMFHCRARQTTVANGATANAKHGRVVMSRIIRQIVSQVLRRRGRGPRRY